MSFSFDTVLIYALPPVAGAAIGYITNAIAIKMLFRPLTEKRFFGIRIPLTPGIIPKQRGNLADSIATMVSAHLLTDEAVRKQINSADFQTSLYNSVSSFTDALLTRETTTLFSEVKQLTETPLPAVTALPQKPELRETVSLLYQGFIRSPGFTTFIRRLIHRMMDYLFASTVSDLVTKFKGTKEILYGITGVLTSEKAHETVQLWIDRFISERLESEASIKELLPVDLGNTASTLMDSMYPFLHEAVTDRLRKPAIKKELETRGKVLLRDIIEKLTPMQRLFVSAARYDQTLDAKMPAIIDDLIKRFEETKNNEELRSTVVAAVGAALSQYEEMSLTGVRDDVKKHVAHALHSAVKTGLNRLGSKRVREKLATLLWERIENHSSMTIGTIFKEYFHLEKDQAVDFLTERATEWLGRSGNELGSTLRVLLTEVLERCGQRSVGELFGIDSQIKETLDSFITSRVLRLLDRKVPEIIHSFNVHALVVEKINSLDMLNVEKLLLMVIEKHLKWINVFGAILGALIGATQVVINRLL